MKLRDLLVLVPPLIVSTIAAWRSVEGDVPGSWLARLFVFAIMFGFVVWLWRRRLTRFPDDPWKFRF